MYLKMIIIISILNINKWEIICCFNVYGSVLTGRNWAEMIYSTDTTGTSPIDSDVDVYGEEVLCFTEKVFFAADGFLIR